MPEPYKPQIKRATSRALSLVSKAKNKTECRAAFRAVVAATELNAEGSAYCVGADGRKRKGCEGMTGKFVTQNEARLWRAQDGFASFCVGTGKK